MVNIRGFFSNKKVIYRIYSDQWGIYQYPPLSNINKYPPNTDLCLQIAPEYPPVFGQVQSHSIMNKLNSMTGKLQKCSFMVKVKFRELFFCTFYEFTLKCCNFLSFSARTLIFRYNWGGIEPGLQ